MTRLSIAVSLPCVTGLPRDVSINTFSFATAEPVGPPAQAEMNARLFNFYNGGATPISAYIGPTVDRTTNVTFHVRNIDVANSTITYQADWNINPGNSGDSLPLEVAVVSSFKGGSPPTPIARRRGRVYIGPLGQNAMGSPAANELPLVNEQLVESMVDAAIELEDSNDLAAWSVWSRADDAFVTVTDGWVNNEFDTQRRRQVSPDFRFTWGV